MLDGHIDRIEIVNHDSIILCIFQRSVDQHDRDCTDAGANLFGARMLRDINNAVYMIARKEIQLTEFLIPIEVIAADEAFIAAAPQNQFQRRNHAAKKGTRDCRQQDADGHGAVCLETAGKNIDGIAQFCDRRVNRKAVLLADVAAVEIFGNGGQRKPGPAGDVLDR